MKGWQQSAVALVFAALLPAPAVARAAASTPAPQAMNTPVVSVAAPVVPVAAPADPAAAAAPAAAPPVTVPAAGRPPTVPVYLPVMDQQWAPENPSTRWAQDEPEPVFDPLWIFHGPLAFEGEVAHSAAALGGGPASGPQHRVILRDGSALPARDEPRLAGGTVRFTDERGTLVSVRTSEVDLAATAAANHLDWPGPGPGAPPAAAPAHPIPPPH